VQAYDGLAKSVIHYILSSSHACNGYETLARELISPVGQVDVRPCVRNILLPSTQIISLFRIPRYPVPSKGRFAIVTDVRCGMRWTLSGRARLGHATKDVYGGRRLSQRSRRPPAAFATERTVNRKAAWILASPS
jgi:hypothetical protein